MTSPLCPHSIKAENYGPDGVGNGGGEWPSTTQIICSLDLPLRQQVTLNKTLYTVRRGLLCFLVLEYPLSLEDTFLTLFHLLTSGVLCYLPDEGLGGKMGCRMGCRWVTKCSAIPGHVGKSQRLNELSRFLIWKAGGYRA